MTATASEHAVSDDVLASYRGLRVTDVCDGMDALGMQDIGQMSKDIRPLWRDEVSFSHRIYGRAYTVRFLPTQRRVPDQSPDEFYEWMRWWYKELAGGPIVSEISPGDVVVIDGYELGTVGFTGSNNTLAWIAAGAVGCVTNGGARDTDEQILQRAPVYCRYVSKTIRPGRIELDATQVAVNCGGATVRPGDLVVADGDGVVVVPQALAEDVSRHAWRHATNDKEGRRRIYRQLNREEDWTVR